MHSISSLYFTFTKRKHEIINGMLHILVNIINAYAEKVIVNFKCHHYGQSVRYPVPLLTSNHHSTMHSSQVNCIEVSTWLFGFRQQNFKNVIQLSKAGHPAKGTARKSKNTHNAVLLYHLVLAIFLSLAATFLAHSSLIPKSPKENAEPG